ncbi:polysaccharide deacetylase family protein [Undibacterium arcticum]
MQTRAVNGGGTVLGRSILRREQADGHLLGFHTATPRHSNHRTMEPQQFESSLQDGIADLSAITGVAPTLVRPPFWNYDARTFAIYQQHGLRVLLTTLSANDGKIYGFHASPTRRSNLLKHLAAQADAIRAGTLPQVDGVTPIVVTFHDVNDYTARHMQEYLQLLLDVAHELQLPVASKPFYDERAALERAALAGTVTDGSATPQLPGFWSWLWN